MSGTEDQIIQQTKNWILQVVIGCNFCPFAAREFKLDTIRFRVEPSADNAACLHAFMEECKRLDEEDAIETTVVILPNAVPDFDDYLELLHMAEELLLEFDYEGVYQVASFHPLYIFAGATEDDASNYTNRSIYPMLHLLREDSVEKALEKYPDAEEIPERNIRYANEKGMDYFKKLWESCL
ncbi:MAG: DUF1415 domain-containing protein [Chitinophagaceae bacterium]|nr:DUF1415 domain-containing protein [Chitinophagaceae bacterium]